MPHFEMPPFQMGMRVTVACGLGIAARMKEILSKNIIVRPIFQLYDRPRNPSWTLYYPRDYECHKNSAMMFHFVFSVCTLGKV